MNLNNKTLIAEINGEEYEAFLSDDGKHVVLYSKESAEDDAEFMGRLEVDGNDIVEFFPMTNRRVVIGKIKV